MLYDKEPNSFSNYTKMSMQNAIMVGINQIVLALKYEELPENEKIILQEIVEMGENVIEDKEANLLTKSVK